MALFAYPRHRTDMMPAINPISCILGSFSRNRMIAERVERMITPPLTIGKKTIPGIAPLK